jgi:hypothetical protein
MSPHRAVLCSRILCDGLVAEDQALVPIMFAPIGAPHLYFIVTIFWVNMRQELFRLRVIPYIDHNFQSFPTTSYGHPWLAGAAKGTQPLLDLDVPGECFMPRGIA